MEGRVIDRHLTINDLSRAAKAQTGEKVILADLIAKAQCHFYGHKRGRMYQTADSRGIAWYECPRCHATWSRKVSQRKAKKGDSDANGPAA